MSVLGVAGVTAISGFIVVRSLSACPAPALRPSAARHFVVIKKKKKSNAFREE